MRYLPGYLLNCWVMVVLVIVESITGEFPYRGTNDQKDGYEHCRPECYSDYVKFRKQQDGVL